MTNSGNLLLLTGDEVRQALHGQEIQIIGAVRAAYEAHAGGETNLPNSVFLHPPGDNTRRIIALPAWLGGEAPAAGIKWIASFPQNRKSGLDRASAAIILNSVETGVPETILEGSVVSAKRTAASAALASEFLSVGRAHQSAGLIGCGPINFEILRFLKVVHPSLKTVFLFDLHEERMSHFAGKTRSLAASIDVSAVRSPDEIYERAALISFATTAPAPHVPPNVRFQPGTTVLHISLRDLAPETVLASDNVTDDVDHVCRAHTSLHLAEQKAGHREFIRCTLADVTTGKAPARRPEADAVIFSPFGLGILDLAVARLAVSTARERQLGREISSFAPAPWMH